MHSDELLQEYPAYRTWWIMARAFHSVRSGLTRFFEERGITGAQFGVLRCAADAGEAGLMLSDLSRHLMVTCGNITGVVDRLETSGLLTRERRSDDRRVIIARLTPAGRELYETTMPAYQELLHGLMGALDPNEQETLGGICEKLHHSLNDTPPDAVEPVAAAAAG